MNEKLVDVRWGTSAHEVPKSAWGGFARDEEGQGTTEYAILVGVLVVMAIISIVAFRGRVQELWDAIASGIGSL